jgi:hypothetical protein
MAVVQNVTLGTLTDEIHLDAVIDTGSTLCVVPPIFARQLGFDPTIAWREGWSALSAVARSRWTSTG